MKKIQLLLITLALLALVAGCIKETYDMDRLSMKAHLSPTLAISAVRGNISISDIKNIPNDTVVFDEDNFIRIVLNEDSVLQVSLDDFEDFDDLAEFHINEVYPVFGASLTIRDTVTFEPGDDIRVERIVVNTGTVNYSIRSTSLAPASFTIKLLSVLRAGIPVTQVINIPANSTVTGSVSLNSADIDLSKDPKMKYNRLPVEYQVTATSGSFAITDLMFVTMDIPSPEFDYAKGYFGNKTESIDDDTLDMEIEDILDRISGEFLLSSPSITLNYSNSFALPVELNLEATGFRGTETVDLGLDPFQLSYPAAPGGRDKSASFTVDKNNSDLPQLVSMPPEKIRFFGSAEMNPGGFTGAMDNYIFGNSRFIAGMEVEIPLEFRIGNLQFTDTTDNFLKIEDEEDMPVNTEDFEFLRIDFEAENGFPLGIAIKMILYDSLTFHNIDTVAASTFLEPANVNAEGRVTEPKSCTTSIEIDREFWSSIKEANRIIFSFTLNTTDGGTKDVKIYSDYGIDFRASLVLKPDIKFDLE
ncbi:MAG: hypothetical protein MUE74_05020 [Bacteroidales bacterium]|nr:hypothetical protein [Bacteroidales bacterium]